MMDVEDPPHNSVPKASFRKPSLAVAIFFWAGRLGGCRTIGRVNLLPQTLSKLNFASVGHWLVTLDESAGEQSPSIVSKSK